MTIIKENTEELLNKKKVNKLQRIKLFGQIVFIILLLTMTVAGFFVFSKYEFITYKDKIIEKEVIKDKIIDNYYIFISDKTKIEYTYNSKKYNQTFGNLFFLAKFNNLQEIYINKLNGKELEKNVSTKDLSIDFDNKDEIQYEILRNGKISILSQKILSNLDLNKLSGVNEDIKIISINGEKFSEDIIISFKSFIDIIKNI